MCCPCEIEQALGDADIVHTDMVKSHANTQMLVEKIVGDHGKKPITLGGDHSITAPICAALAKLNKPITIVQIDAHLDFVDERHGVTHGHGNCMRRCAEMGHIEGLLQLGIRGVSSTAKSGFDAARQEFNSSILSVRDVRKYLTFFGSANSSQGAERLIEHYIKPRSNVYLSVDIDGFDPSIAHGTGTPSHGGFLYHEVKDILRAVILQSTSLVGLDLVEVSPPYDPAQ